MKKTYKQFMAEWYGVNRLQRMIGHRQWKRDKKIPKDQSDNERDIQVLKHAQKMRQTGAPEHVIQRELHKQLKR